MPTPFAAIEARVATTTLAMLANTTATITVDTVSTQMPAIYDAPYRSGSVGDLAVMMPEPMLMVPAADFNAAGAAVGDNATVNGKTFTITNAVPDEVGGTVTLVLREFV